jgi:hypothetical protein
MNPPTLFVHPIAHKQIRGTAVGTILKDQTTWTKLEDAILSGLATAKPEPWGGIFVPFDAATKDLLLAGAVPIPEKVRASDYIVRIHREVPAMFLDRQLLPSATLRPRTAKALVFPKELFMNDPEVTPALIAEFESMNATHALVTLLATGGTPAEPEMGYARFVKNLAGASERFAPLTKEQLVDLAKQTTAYYDNFITVG